MKTATIYFEQEPTCPIWKAVTLTCEKVAGYPIWSLEKAWIEDGEYCREHTVQHVVHYLTKEECRKQAREFLS